MSTTSLHLPDSLTLQEWLCLVFGSLGVIVIWNHVGRLAEWWFRPAVGLGLIATLCETIWEHIGLRLAWCSSFIPHLGWYFNKCLQHFQQVIDSIEELFTPVWRILISPSKVVLGYVRLAISFATPLAIPLGTALIFSVPVGWWWFCQPKQTFIKTGPGDKEGTITNTGFVLLALIAFIAMAAVWLAEQIESRLKPRRPLRPAPLVFD